MERRKRIRAEVEFPCGGTPKSGEGRLEGGQNELIQERGNKKSREIRLRRTDVLMD